jgi:hypothetical protein
LALASIGERDLAIAFADLFAQVWLNPRSYS